MEPIRALLAEARAVAARVGRQPLLRAAITESDMLEGAGQHELAAEVAREGLAMARDTGSPGPWARLATTWPSRWCRWAAGTRPARSSSAR